MEPYLIVAVLIAIHFVADFVLQSDWMARNKSKDNKALLLHVSVYSIPFMVLISPLYGVINGILHFGIDYFTSRLSGRLWARGEVHNFFVIIGFDQLLHALSLIGTYYLLFG